MERKLVKTIAAKEDKRIVCYVNRVDDSYYEVVHNRKSEYLTNSLDTAILVAKIIIVYHQNLNKCNELLYKTNNSEDKKWQTVLELLRREYLKTPIDKRLSLEIYKTLDSNHQELKDSKSRDDMERLSVAATIRAKDNLMEAIYEITSEIEPNVAFKNYNRYLSSRNPYIQKNPYLGLEILFTKEDDKNDERINPTKSVGQTA